MAMEVKGKVIKVMQVQTGAGKGGNWMKQEFVVEQPGQFPKPVCMCLWGEEAITKYDLVAGLVVTAHINLESREYNNRWYTDVRCWRLEWDKQQARPWQNGGDGKPAAAQVERSRIDEEFKDSPSPDSVTDDLPF